MKISTNNVPRDVIDAHELTTAEREQFDYLNWVKIGDGEDSASFFRYHGDLYDLTQFERVSEGGELAALGWQGQHSTSAFSAVVVRYTEDQEQVVVGYVTS